MKSYSYYLFDADGTLFDTADLIYQCFAYTCRKYGNRTITRSEVIRNIGLTLRHQMELYMGVLSDEQFAMIGGDHMAYQLSLYPDYLRLFPKVKEGLSLLKEKGRRCAVVTSRRRNTLDLYLKQTGIYDYFDVLVTPENTKKHKPDPEPVIEALALLGAEGASGALYVGDSEYDIECGSQAGVDTAFVKWSNTDSSKLANKPTYIIDDFMQLCLPAE